MAQGAYRTWPEVCLEMETRKAKVTIYLFEVVLAVLAFLVALTDLAILAVLVALTALAILVVPAALTSLAILATLAILAVLAVLEGLAMELVVLGPYRHEHVYALSPASFLTSIGLIMVLGTELGRLLTLLLNPVTLLIWLAP